MRMFARAMQVVAIGRSRLPAEFTTEMVQEN